MRILDLKNSEKPFAVEITGLITKDEFKQLLGHLDNLALFAADTINEPASHTKTGLRHQYAKYLLLPVKLRRRYRTNQYDFDQLTCGALTNGNRLHIIYTAPTKGLPPQRKNGRWHVKPASSRGNLHIRRTPTSTAQAGIWTWLQKHAHILSDCRWPLETQGKLLKPTTRG